MALGTPYAVVIPYVSGFLRHETWAAVGEEVVYAEVGNSPVAYHGLLLALWAAAEPFVLVEHDIVPPEGAVAALLACPKDWCAYEYECGGLLVTALGCTKFSAALCGRQPDILTCVGASQRGWDGLDAVIIGELRRRNEREHIHRPPVRHLH